MATKKRSRKSTGGKRGRPRKSERNVTAEAPASTPPAALSPDVDSMIAAATAPAPADRTAALDALSRELEQETRDATPVLTGEVHGAPSVSERAVERLSQEVAALAVVVFGLVSMWRGPEWVATEDEAGLIGDAVATPYASEAEELTQKVKWLGPACAIIGIAGKKAVAESQRRQAQRDERMPGTAPSNG